MPKESRLTDEQDMEIAMYLKSNPNLMLKDVCKKFEIGHRVLGRIRRKYGMYDGFTKRLTKDQSTLILEFMRNNPLTTYDELVNIFGSTQKQLAKIRYKDKNLPNLMWVTKRKKNNSYLTPEVEQELVEYMRINTLHTYEDIMKEFKCSIRQVERSRAENKFPPIKRRPATTHQSILRKEGKRYCPKCDTIKLQEDFLSYRQSCCAKCEKIRECERVGTGDLEKFILVKIKQSLNRVNRENDLSLSKIIEIYNIQSGKCYYSGRTLVLEKCNPFSLSIDRISSDLGYTGDNVVLCCSMVNYMKQEYDYEVFLNICNEISRSHPRE